MIKTEKHIVYFAGDTAYGDHFKQISEQFPKINIALIPIGPCEPKIWMNKTHLNAEQSIQAFIDLKNARKFIPMHWGTFQFGTDNIITPIQRVKQSWHENHPKLIGKTLYTLEHKSELRI